MEVVITIMGSSRKSHFSDFFSKCAKIMNFRMISSDYSSEDDEVEDESLVLQPSKKLPVIIFRPEVRVSTMELRTVAYGGTVRKTISVALRKLLICMLLMGINRGHPAAFVF